jgi:hypothetical protein
MPFDSFTPRMKDVATAALAFCKRRYGANGLRIEEGIDKTIGWRPSFFIRQTRFLLLAVEVAENIYPEALKGAAHDIGHFDLPIAVFQVCPLDTFQNDHKQTRAKLLRSHGFGLITVDEDGCATIQHSCVPLAQHIPPEQLESELCGLSRGLKVQFKSAYETYLANAGQGLQQAGQVVENLVNSIAAEAVKRGIIQSAAGNLADLIDRLYAAKPFQSHRASLGSARGFVNEFRNTASHPQKSAKQAAEKIRKCKAGFLESIGVVKKLYSVAKALGFPIRLYLA